jgi:hypothetical protein
MTTLEKILGTIVEDIGVPALIRWLTARTSEDQLRAILDAEYQAARAAADAEANAVLAGPEGPEGPT